MWPVADPVNALSDFSTTIPSQASGISWTRIGAIAFVLLGMGSTAGYILVRNLDKKLGEGFLGGTSEKSQWSDAKEANQEVKDQKQQEIGQQPPDEKAANQEVKDQKQQKIGQQPIE